MVGDAEGFEHAVVAPRLIEVLADVVPQFVGQPVGYVDDVAQMQAPLVGAVWNVMKRRRLPDRQRQVPALQRHAGQLGVRGPQFGHQLA